MSLSAGSRLGPYEILSPLGAGGMGEVYRARDTRLERTVAVKVLPQHLSSSAEVRQRFEREAKTISQLSHPHICALYDVGRENDTEYLVMEYLEGETLTARLANGPLPLEQTLRYGQEIADALDKAHRQGIVHRDLKPGNIMLTKSGVKLLDFGLAKVMEPTQPSGATSLPTVMGSAQNLTQEGTILGTFQYMAPEQLEGKDADARADIFAFGAVLYEAATGAKAFSGASQASLISAILRDEPRPISQLQPASPAALDRIVRTCLAKDPEERWQSAADLKRELRWIAEGSQTGALASVQSESPRARARRLPWLIAGALALGLIASLWPRPRGASGPAKPRRFSILPPVGGRFGDSFAISPDGGSLVFVAGAGREIATVARVGALTQDETPMLWLRTFDAAEARALKGTEGATFPFWSPDGKQVGFFGNGKMKAIDVGGGGVRVLTDVQEGRGGAWSPQGVIIFAPTYFGALQKVSDRGGKAEPATSLSEPIVATSHRFPTFLPDGRFFLAVTTPDVGASVYQDHRICAGSIDRKAVQCFAPGATNVGYSRGQLVFTDPRGLVAQPFEPKSLTLSGEPRLLAEGVGRFGAAGATGYSPFSVASDGTVVYGRVSSTLCRIVWVDRTGREQGEPLASGTFNEPYLTADGTRAVLLGEDPQRGSNDVWSIDLARGALSRLTFHSGQVWSPAISPDGTRIVYSQATFGGNAGDLYVSSAAGTGKGEVLWKSSETKFTDDWSPDGKTLLVEVLTPTQREDVWTLSMAGDPSPKPLLATPFSENEARFSPDGRFIAYVSDETGRPEIYVQTYPPSASKWQISHAGGIEPQWRRDGKELYFLTASGEIAAADVHLSPGFAAGEPRMLFPAGIRVLDGRNQYAPSIDGQRFLVLRATESKETPSLTVLLGALGAEESRR